MSVKPELKWKIKFRELTYPFPKLQLFPTVCAMHINVFWKYPTFKFLIVDGFFSISFTLYFESMDWIFSIFVRFLLWKSFRNIVWEIFTKISNSAHVHLHFMSTDGSAFSFTCLEFGNRTYQSSSYCTERKYTNKFIILIA